MIVRQTHDDDAVQRAIRVAEGWLELGAPRVAWDELKTLESSNQANPAVLYQQARVLVALGQIGEARGVVRRLARLAPAWRLALLDDPALDPVWT